MPNLFSLAAGRNVAVRAGIDIGIHAQRDRRAHSFAPRDAIDAGELRFALDVETQDALLERIFDFLPGFADAGEGAISRIAAGREDAKEFAAGNDVEPRAFPRKQIEDGAIRIRFDRVADQVIDLAQRRIEPSVMIENRARAVDIERRAILLGDAFKIHAFAMQAAVVITK